LASQNFLAFIITDESLCYGTNFPISNVILTDDLVKNLNMNEMFQLIGRAGRVGQSWTARAFLEPKGLKKYTINVI
jgi:superfamily II helicase